MKVPCEKCLIVPICRHKHFIDMRVDCEILHDFLMANGRKIDGYGERAAAIFNFLKPTKWGYLAEHRRETILDMQQQSSSNYIKIPKIENTEVSKRWMSRVKTV